MEFDNILEEKVKVKGKYKIPLIIIGIVVIGLIGVAGYLYFKSSDPKTVYTSIIDGVSNSVLELLDDISEENDGARGYDYGFTFDLDSNNQEFEEVANILNKIKLDFGVALDINAKKAKLNLGATYKKENMINADIVVNNNVMYGDLNDLYEKPIKISNSGVEQMWETVNYDEYKVIVTEFTNILKSNLKDEYFSNDKEKIEALGKKINANKSTLTLTKEDFKELVGNVCDDINNNDTLVLKLANVLKITKEEVKGNIKDFKDNIEFEYNELVIDIYQHNLEVVNIVIDIDDERLIINEVKDDQYEVSINYDGNKEVVASVNINDEEQNILYNYKDLIFEIKSNDESILIKMELPEGILELKMNEVSDALVDGYLRINSIEDDMNLRIDFTVEDKNVQEIKDMDITNYIDLEAMTDEDYNRLMQNLTENAAVMSLVQDILALDSFSSLMTY